MDRQIVESIKSLIEPHMAMPEHPSGHEYTTGVFPLERLSDAELNLYDYYHDNNQEEFEQSVVENLPVTVEFISYNHQDYTITLRKK